jgi:GWxTD domain-containing protein
VSGQKLILRFAVIIVSLFSFSSFVASQSEITPTDKAVKRVRQAKQPDAAPEDQARKVKTEPGNAYTRWVNEDVDPIITAAERAAFQKLTTNEEREEFIKIFWGQRDPDPDTEENEYREQYYERIAYANEHFSSGKPGWKTDRGRIYIKFGKPDGIESHPGGGPYQKSNGESTTGYPFETWFYRYLPGVRSGVEIEFVDPSGSGEYRIARNSSEKDALAHMSGSDSLAGDSMNAGFVREQDTLFGRIELLHDLEKPLEIVRRNRGGTTGSPTIDDNPLNFDVRADFFKMSEGRVITAFTVQADNKDLVFESSGGLQTARLNIFGKIVTVTDRRVGAFEDSVSTSATVAELTDAKERKSAYSKAVVLAPGRYRADVIVRDVVSGATGARQFAFQVPKYEEGTLSTSSMILATRLENIERGITAGPFVIGQTKVVPNMTGLYHRGQPVGVYLQVYNAGIDQTTLRPSVDVEYLLSKDGKEVRKQVEDWRGISDSGQRLTLARLMDTQALAVGEYELMIRIRDRVSGQTLTPVAKFSVTQ